MVVLCPSCSSTEIIFDDGCQYHCCTACGIVLDANEFGKNDMDPVNENSGNANSVTLPRLLESRYQPIFEKLQSKFMATNEETDFVRQLCFVYLTHADHVFENNALEVVLCLFYLVVLQHHQDQSLLLTDYCQLVDADSKRCLTIYSAVRIIVSTKLAILPTDYDPQHQLDNVMRFLYPALLQSTSSSSTPQHGQQRSRSFLSYHATPFTTHKKSKRTNKERHHQQPKRQRISATVSSTASDTAKALLSTIAPNATTATYDDRPQQFDTNDDTATNLGPGESLNLPNHMNETIARQQTTRLMTVIKRNGLADGRYGRPLMSACLLITMIGWFHHQQKVTTTTTTSTGVNKRNTPRCRSASLLPVVMIHWDELCSHQLVNSTTKTRYKEIVGLLYTFAKTLPWIKDNLAMERDVLHYLDDILQFMDVLQTNNNKHTGESQISTAIATTTTIGSTSSRQATTIIPSTPVPASDAISGMASTTTTQPFLPPSFERATRARQKRIADLDAYDQWHHLQQQNDNDNKTKIGKEDSGLTTSVRMVTNLLASQQYDREAILAMSDRDLISHAYRFSSTLTARAATPSTLDLDRQLDDFDLSEEEWASYRVTL